MLVQKIRHQVLWGCPPQPETSPSLSYKGEDETAALTAVQPSPPASPWDRGKGTGKAGRCYQRPPFHKPTFKFSFCKLATGRAAGERENRYQKWMDVGPHPQPDHTVRRDTTDPPAIVNNAITLTSAGGPDTGVCWSVLNNQLSRVKEALSRNSCQCPWCKYSHYGQFQAPSIMSQNRDLGKICTRVHHHSASPSSYDRGNNLETACVGQD